MEHHVTLQVLNLSCTIDFCRFGKYELHDLVVLDQQTTGIIVSVEKETCRVLTTEVQPCSFTSPHYIVQTHHVNLAKIEPLMLWRIQEVRKILKG